MAGFSSRTRRNELRVIDAIIANPGWVPKLQCDAAPAAAFKATTRYKVLLSQLERAEAAGSDSSAQLSSAQRPTAVNASAPLTGSSSVPLTQSPSINAT